MIKVGDMVKVIDKCYLAMGVSMEIIPIGTICEVKEVTKDDCFALDGKDYGLWWYISEQIERV